jgi:hypothetical protein
MATPFCLASTGVYACLTCDPAGVAPANGCLVGQTCTAAFACVTPPPVDAGM